MLFLRTAVLCLASAMGLAGAASSQTTGNYTFIPHPAVNDETAFTPIFDGRSLKGWSADPVYWRVENGAIVGETTPETLLKDHNNFVIWGGRVQDFELRLSYRISPAGNSGVNYRSVEMPDVKWTMKGYQFDLDGPESAKLSRQIMVEHGLKVPSFEIPGKLIDPPPKPRVTGNIYEERGRAILALAGTLGRTSAMKGAHVDAFLASENIVQEIEKPGWNEIRIIARANVIIHVLNGRVISTLVDDDPVARPIGSIGLQVHVGPPMKVEFRDIRLRAIH